MNDVGSTAGTAREPVGEAAAPPAPPAPPAAPPTPRGAHSLMSGADALLFVFATAAAAWLAYLLLAESIGWSWQLALLLVFWLLVAYLVLPRLHRVLTYIYVPGYFIGRTRTSDGLLGDPVNLALRGDEAQVHAAMGAAGWTLADEVTLGSSVRIIRTTLSPAALPAGAGESALPVRPATGLRLPAGGQRQPPQRHHVRFWRCPPGWRLPGGHLVDWLAAGTFDRRVGLSLMTFQVTHRIARHIDIERDHIVATVSDGAPGVSVERIPHFASGYHARNGGGDQMVTDGDLPVVDLRRVAPPASAAAVAVREPGNTRPPATVFSAAVSWLRALAAAVLAWSLLADPGAAASFTGRAISTAAASSGALALGLVAAVDVGLGTATYAGRNWARVLLMAVSTVDIVVAFLVTADGGPRPTVTTSLPHITLSILLLLALTSPRARQYALRR